jgi:hypothetical protein
MRLMSPAPRGMKPAAPVTASRSHAKGARQAGSQPDSGHGQDPRSSQTRLHRLREARDMGEPGLRSSGCRRFCDVVAAVPNLPAASGRTRPHVGAGELVMPAFRHLTGQTFGQLTVRGPRTQSPRCVTYLHAAATPIAASSHAAVLASPAINSRRLIRSPRRRAPAARSER